MRTGVVLQGVDTPAEFSARVERIEELGYDDLWLTDSSLHARNCYSYLTLAAVHSSRLRLGTAVTNPLTRHPGITAAAAATVQEISEGRFVLGLGAGDRPLEALGLRPAKLAVLDSTIEDVRALLRGSTVQRDGGAYRFDDAHLRFGDPVEVPIFISASGPRTLELAGRIADGVILLAGLFSDGVRWAMDHLARGAASVGRPVPPVHVFAYGAIDDDTERALAAARSIAAWFPQTAPHYCELAGLDPDIAEQVRARYRGGEFQEAAAAAELLPAEFVHRMALAGDEAAALEHLRTLSSLGVAGVDVFPLGDRRAGTIESFAAAAAALRSAGGDD